MIKIKTQRRLDREQQFMKQNACDHSADQLIAITGVVMKVIIKFQNKHMLLVYDVFIDDG